MLYTITVKFTELKHNSLYYLTAEIPSQFNYTYFKY